MPYDWNKMWNILLYLLISNSLEGMGPERRAFWRWSPTPLRRRRLRRTRDHVRWRRLRQQSRRARRHQPECCVHRWGPCSFLKGKKQQAGGLEHLWQGIYYSSVPDTLRWVALKRFWYHTYSSVMQETLGCFNLAELLILIPDLIIIIIIIT